MQTTIDFLDAVKAAHGLTSDYQLAKVLGVERQAISHYRAGRTLGEETAVRVAELLEIDWAYIIACIHAERAKGGDAKKLWARLAKQLAPATLAILAGCSLLFGDPSAFDITPRIAHSATVPFIHYAHFVTGLILAAVTAWTLGRARTCSARSR